VDDLEDLSRRAERERRLGPAPPRSPWFTGNGKWLMIAVLALCAVLIVLRSASTMWLLKDVARWWVGPVARPVTINLKPSNGLKSIPTIIGNAGRYFSPDDYPEEALRRGQTGRTVARLAIAPDGTMLSCSIMKSSGAASLDAATCDRAVHIPFRPARDDAGQPIVGYFILPVRWQLPD
jgi:TonB family protein